MTNTSQQDKASARFKPYARLVVLGKRAQHIDLNDRSISVFLNIANDLNGHILLNFPIPALQHPTECSCTAQESRYKLSYKTFIEMSI